MDSVTRLLFVVGAVGMGACSLTSLNGLSGGQSSDASAGLVEGGVSPSDAAIEGGAQGSSEAGGGGGGGDGAALRAAILADRPVGYWRFEETAGTRFKDEVGSNDAMATGSCRAGVAGVGGSRAIELDGLTCALDVGEGFNFASQAPFTIEMWAWRQGDNFNHLFTRQVRNGDNPLHGYTLVINQNAGLYFERVTNGNIRATAAVNIPGGRFTHVAAVFDGTKAETYVDGTLRESRNDTSALPSISARALIGAKSDGGYFAGQLDELAIYDHALNATQIAAHHQAANQ